MKVSPGPHQRHERFLVGGAARVRLHVGELALEELLGALDGQRLGLVDDVTAAVVAVAGIALGVLVGEHGAGGLEHGARDEVLGRDQLDLVLLAFELAADDAGDLGIALGQAGGEEGRRRRQSAPGSGSGHRLFHARVDAPEWRAALISWGSPRQQAGTALRTAAGRHQVGILGRSPSHGSVARLGASSVRSCRLYLAGLEAEHGDLSRGEFPGNGHRPSLGPGLGLGDLGQVLRGRLHGLVGSRNRHVEVFERWRAHQEGGVAPWGVGRPCFGFCGEGCLDYPASW